jgi:hypothetical protein
MGEVYRATDTKLGREVAIKVLPAEVVGDPERLARFEREAKLLASLNHPNIAAIHGLEEAEGTPFLALELVEGEDLKERLGRGPLPVERPLGPERGYQWGARTSPDGRWLAYASNETGRDEVYVEPLEGGGRWQVSTDGGTFPLWGPEGRTLYFADHLGLYRVDVRTGDRFDHGTPERLFEGHFRLQAPPLPHHDISPRGDTFVLVQPGEARGGPREIVVNLNWFAELERLVSAGR